MKRATLLFLLAVFVPSVALACLAIRSLYDQQFVLERQLSLIYQGVADGMAKDVRSLVLEKQRELSRQVEAMLREQKAAQIAPGFDLKLREQWPLAEVGFVVTTDGKMLAPNPRSGPLAQQFFNLNCGFLGNKQSAEVYTWAPQANNTAANSQIASYEVASGSLRGGNNYEAQSDNSWKINNRSQQRAVMPQQNLAQSVQQAMPAPGNKGDNNAYFNESKILPLETEFGALLGKASEGTLARFVDNRLSVLVWFRPPAETNYIFGAQLSLPQLRGELPTLMEKMDPTFREEICVALLDDIARPVTTSHPEYRGHWKHPFVATEIGEVLPHWEIGVYLLNPAKLKQTARSLKLMLSLIMSVLVLAMGIGSLLLISDMRRQLALARQKTDFVSNVSHELKTPLTSIRMFSEMLAEGRVQDPAKQRSYLNIITAEAARLTRLINNVLDFSRLERAEKTYQMQPLDLAEVVGETVAMYRPHLEAGGFRLRFEPASGPLPAQADRDAVAQVLVNLLANAEKYSGENRDIGITLQAEKGTAEIRVSDAGLGVPKGCEEKIFEQFFRAHDALGSGIQGSGLGLTLARQIARAHGGDVLFSRREGGGSCFTLRLPLQPLPPVS